MIVLLAELALGFLVGVKKGIIMFPFDYIFTDPIL